MSNLLRRSQFMHLLPYKISKHYKEIEKGYFPKGIERGCRMVFWAESEVNIMLDAYLKGASNETLYKISRDIENKRDNLEVMKDE